ncbi:response regulator transcription factor [Jiella sp. MQZ9-1]|uniref:Response regulator transcription factor n=1 Tax=Jiella flava TaxID=2816857 RepID=A0A939G1G1_9HYPH|nr:response regulator transcription factor [Jiella flava]MBO0663808.1 response regulator transcription factor [Jiella flava]MCD2472381.1 response regulator transcription factor [Jiella flava]
MAEQHPRSQSTRVFLLEANPLVVSAISGLVAEEEDLKLTRVTDRGTDLITATDDDIDLAVIAWELADMKAVEVLRRLKAKNSPIRAVVFSNNREPSALRQAVRLGARGYCYQQDDVKIFFTTLRAVAAGQICIPYIDLASVNDTPLAALNVRERELLDILARGWTNQQIANRIGMSENTVKYYLKNIYEKLNVRNRSMAVALWTREIQN